MKNGAMLTERERLLLFIATRFNMKPGDEDVRWTVDLFQRASMCETILHDADKARLIACLNRYADQLPTGVGVFDVLIAPAADLGRIAGGRDAAFGQWRGKLP